MEFKKSQKPPQEQWACGQDGVCHRTKAVFAHSDRAAVDVHDKRWKKDL